MSGEQASPGKAEVGDDLPEMIIESVSAEKMKTMAALLGDPNTIHWDVDDVRRLGLGDRPVNQGPNNMGYVIDMLADWAGDPANFRRLKVRFLGNVFAEDRLVAGGKVTAVRPSPDGRLVDCDVWLARDGTEPVLAGTATVLLPG
ncbi:MAG: MaoC family dehydratase [Acidimicrobiia bacterium]|nr:MaoC family dehydratase [Acidimicrobiia bacterium]MYC46085.1 MaoC family dehydratase [Acidimicrobiia bacterium]MYI20919.1 MaoC family dehydratase [Acidimicrobiia bacterium]